MKRFLGVCGLLALLWPALAFAQSPVVPCAQGQPTANSSTPSCATTITPIASASAESTHVFKTTAGSLVWLEFTNTGSNAGYVAILNATAAPSGGGAMVPLFCAAVAANASVAFPLSGVFFVPANFSTGIVAVASATGGGCSTYTTSSQPAGWFSAEVQ